jgi:superfamily II RNA helicase
MLPPRQDVQLLSADEEREIRKGLVAFGAKHPEALRELGVRPLLRGIAAHHAGCLPTWKSFIEELFQRGLVKVVFATETLAAGINMPARTTVLASLSKRGDNGHALLSSNSMLQMAGRAGRRGIDKQGHVVVVQTPFEGAEDCCRLLFAGSDPLVSQFTATYGMALNLLAVS